MALQTIPTYVGDGTLTVEDGTPLSVTIGHQGGGISITGISASDEEALVIQDRDGAVVGLRAKTKGAKGTFSFELYLEDLVDGAAHTLVSLVRGTDASAARVTTHSIGDLVTLKVTLTIVYEGNTQTIVLNDCYCEIDLSEGEPSTISLSGTRYGTMTITDS